MTDPSLFNTVLVWPILNALVGIYKILFLLNTPYALGFSIIGLTVVIRFILYPLTASQLRASRKMQEVSPHLSKLKEKHKNDAKMLQQETMKLYKEHGVNPAAGCLPVLVQIPIIWGLYSVLSQIVALGPQSVVSSIHKVVDFASAFQSQSLYIFPLMIGFFSYQFPIGLSLYWNTFTVFGIIQQYQISGPGGLESLWQKKKKQ